MNLLRTTSSNTDFIELVKDLDADLAIRDGDEHEFYAQFNKTSNMKYVIVAYEGSIAVGCGAIKEYSRDSMEIKRMYTLPVYRGKGIATLIMAELEKWAAELSNKKCVLETGKNQPEAIHLYEKIGYHRIPNYGQYADKENSICFEKVV